MRSIMTDIRTHDSRSHVTPNQLLSLTRGLATWGVGRRAAPTRLALSREVGRKDLRGRPALHAPCPGSWLPALPSPHQLLPILGARAGTKVQQSRCLGHDIEGGFCAQSHKCSQLSLDVTSSKKPSVNPIHPDLLGCPSWLSPPIKLHVNAH